MFFIHGLVDRVGDGRAENNPLKLFSAVCGPGPRAL